MNLPNVISGVCDFLHLDLENRAYFLEDYIAEHGLPNSFAVGWGNFRITTLALPYLINATALLAAANQIELYVGDQLDVLLRHLVQQDDDKIHILMQLLLSQPMLAARALVCNTHIPELAKLCEENHWQLGWMLEKISSMEHTYKVPLTLLPQLTHWLIARAITGDACNLQKFCTADNLAPLLKQVIKHPELQFRYDNAAQFLLNLKELKPESSKLKLNNSDLKNLLELIKRDNQTCKAAINKNLYPTLIKLIPKYILKNILTISAILLFMEIAQVILFYNTGEPRTQYSYL